MRKEKDFIYRLALRQSFWQLVPNARPLEEGAEGGWGMSPGGSPGVGPVWETDSGRRAFRESGVRTGRGPAALLSSFGGDSVLTLPPEIRRDRRAYLQEGDTHAKGWCARPQDPREVT